MAQLKPHGPHHYYLWDYLPSRPAAIAFIALFALATLVVTWQSIRTRTRFSIPFIIGGVFELVGYVGRFIAYEHTDQLIPFIIQSILILIAPALFAASIYMTLGRLIRSIDGEQHSIIRVRVLTRIFVIGDVLSFLVQGSGGGLMASKNFNQNTAQDIVLAGLGIQVIMFGLFVLTAAIFHLRILRKPTAASMDSRVLWKTTMLMLYAASTLIMVRSIFRVVEYVMGKGGYPMKHEWTLYVFDAALMLLTMIVFIWRYPGHLSARLRNWDSEELKPSPDMGSS